MGMINNSLVAVFNYAVKYHDLKENPCDKAGSIGSNRSKEMNIWTVDEFEKFVKELQHKPVSYIGFNILFWTGIRIGELLALTVEDIDLDNKIIRINKSCQRIGKRDVITEPKTQKSIRNIRITKKLVTIMEKYLSLLYNVSNDERIIKGSKQTFRYDMKIYSEKARIKKIRIHDLRHSHASVLINLGVNPLSIAKRLGHEKIETTLNIYSHLYPEQEKSVIDLLEKF